MILAGHASPILPTVSMLWLACLWMLERRRGPPFFFGRRRRIRPWRLYGEYFSNSTLNFSCREANVWWSNPNKVTRASSCPLLNSLAKADWRGWWSAARQIFPCLKRRDWSSRDLWKEGVDASWSTRMDNSRNSSTLSSMVVKSIVKRACGLCPVLWRGHDAGCRVL